MWFASDQPDARELLAGLDALTEMRVSVVGAVNLWRENREGFDRDYERRHLMAPYQRMDFMGHNAIRYSDDLAAWPFYTPCPSGGFPLAMAVILAERDAMCPDAADRRIPLGAPLFQGQPEALLAWDESCGAAPWRRPQGDCLPASPDTRGKIMIVGSFADDQSPYAGRPGPEIVAWAVSDLLQTSGAENPFRQLLNRDDLHLGLALAASAVAFLVFVALLRFIRRWRLTPWRIALIAGAAGLLVPGGMFAVARLMGHDFTQVLFPIAAMIWTLGLAAYIQSGRAREIEDLREAARHHDYTAYDVFISYRHAHSNWVHNELLPILEAIPRHDGQPLRVFLDRDGIRLGADFTARLATVIDESRIFLAVLSPDYFDRDKPYCRWELQNALQREPLGMMAVIPLWHDAFGPSQIPKDFPQLKYKMGLQSNDPRLPDALAREIRDALAKIGAEMIDPNRP
jgi:hypothetical protein